MQKLTSKITMKIEPGLLETIQAKAEIEGMPVSSYIRKAVISYIGKRQGIDQNILEIELTDMEKRAINRLMILGVVKKEEDALHSAFDLFLKEEYDRIADRAEKMFIDDQIIRVGAGKGLYAQNSRTGPLLGQDLQLEPDDGDGDR